MQSNEIRQSFLDFFASKGHKIVESCSLLPESPNLLFTNAGMNPFVPYFLGERTAKDKRIADTQKCLRAGGKHNDLEEVGFDTYHHTFFEMLGNWSLGDYFKKEAIEWAWELLTEVWKFPKERLYATVYRPSKDDPAEFDEEAYLLWRKIFETEGLDPKVHILNGDKKDNFWMMGDTGPCGPCTEIHIDLTPEGNTRGQLVNKGDARCMEIWNLVFIQYNALHDGRFEPLKDKFVDTGMGLERVAGIYATTNGFRSFQRPASNYDSDLFTDIFAPLEKWSNHTYEGRVPQGRQNLDALTFKDCAFRTLADHVRTLTFAIADGILPGNEGRHYVLRRILRRALLFGQRLSLPQGFFSELSQAVIKKMGPIFKELTLNAETIKKVLNVEENAFQLTLQKGLQLFERWTASNVHVIDGEKAFLLYDTYGFPLDLTQLLAGERGLTVDLKAFQICMQAQQKRSQASQKKTTIHLHSENEQTTLFVGYEDKNLNNFNATLLDVIDTESQRYLIFDRTPFYPEKGGQVGDSGTAIFVDGQVVDIQDTVYKGNIIVHRVEKTAKDLKGYEGQSVQLSVDSERRKKIQRHHTATHLLHWALRKVLGKHVKQAGSLVSPDYLRFDFSHFEKIDEGALEKIEHLCLEQILANRSLNTKEVSFDERPSECLAFFGEKYGDKVRVVQIEGCSMELCGGTHTNSTGELGLLKIRQEGAIAAGVRRIEAVVGESAFVYINSILREAKMLEELLASPLEKVAERYKRLFQQKVEFEKKYLQALQASTSKSASSKEAVVQDLRCVCLAPQVGDNTLLRSLGKQYLSEQKPDVLLVYGQEAGKGYLLAFCAERAIQKGISAHMLIKHLLVPLGANGGGKPDFANGGVKDYTALKLAMEALDFEQLLIKTFG